MNSSFKDRLRLRLRLRVKTKILLFFFLTLALALALTLTLTSILSFAATPEPPPTPPNYVNDLAGVIRDDVKTQLNGYLRELEQKTTAQVLVLTVQSLDGEDIAGFSLRTAEKWKPGQKGKDNGVLLTIAVKDRKYRFEIGYGLESILPDSLVGTIGRQYLVPYLRKGDYSSGIANATLAIVQTIAGREGVEITGMPETPVTVNKAKGKRVKGIGLFDAIIGIVFIIGAIILFIRHPGLFLLLLMGSSRRGGGWSGGGGFGDGGFGGGGGGSFGGGGASGDW